MNPWLRDYNQPPAGPFSFFHSGPPQGFPFQQNRFNQGPIHYQQPTQPPFIPPLQPPFIPPKPQQYVQQQQTQLPQQQPFLQQQFPQQSQPFPKKDPLAAFKTEDGTIDFNKVNSSIQQVMGVANQIGPLMKTFGLFK